MYTWLLFELGAPNHEHIGPGLPFPAASIISCIGVCGRATVENERY